MIRTAGDLAQYLNIPLAGDPGIEIAGVASPERAAPADLIYLASPRRRGRVSSSAARCVIAEAGTRISGKTILEATDPKFAFAKAAGWILERTALPPAIHPSAIVAPSAKLAKDVSVAAYAVIEDDVEIGSGTLVGAFCFLGRGVRLGSDCRLHPRVTLYAGVRLGTRVEVHSGAVIGADGFGYVFGEGRHWKFPQIGEVEIGDDVEIGANTTIDRGSLETTRIGNGVKIDNLVQIAHNVTVGEHCVLAAQTGISGSSSVGQRVIAGGQVGIGDHCHIEDSAIIGGQAGILSGKTIRSGQVVWGTPARPLDQFKRQYGQFARLPELAERVRRLEKK